MRVLGRLCRARILKVEKEDGQKIENWDGWGSVRSYTAEALR